MYAYFITGITYEGKEKTILPNRGQRCFGYFSTFEEAEEAVLSNCCDIWETIYEYVVIEKIREGIHQIDLEPMWYKWNLEKECYEKIEKPEFADGYVGWGIG